MNKGENIKTIIQQINADPFSADALNQKQLETVIQYAADAFFNTKQSVMEDSVYDILVDFLKEKYPKSKVLNSIGFVPKKNKVTLDYWLGSMDKIKPGSKDFDKWFGKYAGPYVVSDKLDGVSAALIYRTNGKINLYTRGTAEEGTDITRLLKYFTLPTIETIRGIKAQSTRPDILMAFRGELILKRATFQENWSQTMKNARNTVSGLVNSNTIQPTLAKQTDFVVYEIIDPIMLPSQQLALCQHLGFNTVAYKTVRSLTLTTVSNIFKQRRTESPYDVDGIIVTNDALYERNTKSNPEYSFAFKDVLDDQVAEATVLGIEWNVSKDGLIKPVLLLKPVQIGGVEISRVTAHNARNVVQLQLGKGAIIKLVRSGDVIPKIIAVIQPASPSHVVLPPADQWHWNESNVDIVLNNNDSKERLIKNIYHFFSTLKTMGMGEKVIEKLVDAKIDTIEKILRATSFEQVQGIQKRGSDNLLQSIRNSVSKVTLSRLIVASNMAHGLGEERIKSILQHYPHILTEYKKWSHIEFVEKIKAIHGFEDKLSQLFADRFDAFVQFYNTIRPYIGMDAPKPPIVKQTSKYSGMTIVMSGFRSDELKQFLENAGAKIVGSVSKNTNLLIVKDQETINQKTGKVKQALDLHIPIVTKDAFQ
jgi:NAD-dependent DNA ligase